MTLEEIGRGLGWMGGILYLIQLIEYRVKSTDWWLKRSLARMGPPPSRTPVQLPVMHLHKVSCELCGKNTNLNPICEHPDAPKYEPVITAAPVQFKQEKP